MASPNVPNDPISTKRLATRGLTTGGKCIGNFFTGKQQNLNSSQRLASSLFFGTLILVPALSGAARASSSATYFLETIGISTAVGTVLGASTLPFYDQPGDHTSNIAIGASAGAIVGVGIFVYGLLTRPSQDQLEATRLQNQRLARALEDPNLKRPAYPALVKMPLVSLRF
jgi:hypothetical protein